MGHAWFWWRSLNFGGLRLLFFSQKRIEFVDFIRVLDVSISTNLFFIGFLVVDGSIGFVTAGYLSFKCGLINIETSLFAGLVKRRGIIFPDLVSNILVKIIIFFREGEGLRVVIPHTSGKLIIIHTKNQNHQFR